MIDFYIGKIENISEDVNINMMYTSDHFNTYLISETAGIIPSRAMAEIESDEIDGTIFLDSIFESREFELDCILVVDKPEQVFKKYTSFLSLLYNLGEFRLVLGKNQERFISCYLNGGLDLDQYPFHQGFQLPLLAPDPFWYSLEYKAKTLTGSNSSIITNNGNYLVRPNIIIKGPAVNPSITINSNTFEYTGSLSAVDTLEINCKERTTRFNQSNADKGSSKSFPYLIPGANTITNSSGNTTIYYRDCWL